MLNSHPGKFFKELNLKYLRITKITNYYEIRYNKQKEHLAAIEQVSKESIRSQTSTIIDVEDLPDTSPSYNSTPQLIQPLNLPITPTRDQQTPGK